MKIENCTAPRAVRYSAPCCSRQKVAAPRDVTIQDSSAPCCSRGVFQTLVTAPRADLKSITRQVRGIACCSCSGFHASRLSAPRSENHLRWKPFLKGLRNPFGNRSRKPHCTLTHITERSRDASSTRNRRCQPGRVLLRDRPNTTTNAPRPGWGRKSPALLPGTMPTIPAHQTDSGGKTCRPTNYVKIEGKYHEPLQYLD